MPNNNDNSGPMVGLSWNHHDTWKKAPNSFEFPNSFTAEPPWQSFSNTLKTAKTSANSLVLYAKANPNVQKLVNGYEEWECNLRKEARARLSNVKRLQNQFTHGLAAEDWDLLRRVSNSPSSYSSMKRSASDNSLVQAGGREAYDRARDWQVPVGVGFSTESLFAARDKNNFPRVPSVPEITLQARTINTEAAKNFEALATALVDKSKQALQTAQQGLQQTAYNCQQNLQTLGMLLQQNSPSLPLSNTQILAQVVSGGSQQHSNLNLFLPWSVLPKYMQVRELAAGAETSSSGTDDPPFWPTYELFHSEQKPSGTFKSLRDPGRQVAIVTTAALPWLTGTSVNPLLRATYMSQDTSRKVTLVVPWLSKKDQERLFPNHIVFDTPEQQEQYIREWARERTGFDCSFKITFYPGRYAPEKGSILPVGDITACIPDHEADVAVLEEPEHLNWFHHGKRWTDKFSHVVGVMHTNYLDYARREEGGNMKEFLLKHINAWVCRVHCHKVIKLSNAVQPLPRETTMFVHGVSPAFLKVGEKKAEAATTGSDPWPRGAYFIGKALWAKGYTELLDRLKEHAERTGNQIPVDVYGSGPDLPHIQDTASERHLSLDFKGPKDHADATLQEYKVFINPSLSDVVATTTAEALAMGKWVVCAKHPSNEFFSQFDNCLVYETSEQFSQCLDKALKNDPKPLSASDLRKLTWEDATERFLDVAEIHGKPNPVESMVDNFLAGVHNTLSGMEPFRVAAGAGAKTRDMPLRITDYEPSMDDVGGIFDNTSRAKKAYAKSS